MNTKRTLKFLSLFLCLLLVFLGSCLKKPNDTPDQHELTGLRIDSSNAKVDYVVGETYSSSGLKVYAVYSDGEAELSLSDLSIDSSAVNMSKVGNYNVHVKYGSYTKSYVVYVSSSIYVKTLTLTKSESVKTLYIVGDTFDPTGLELTAEWSDGTKETLDASKYVSGFNATAAVNKQTLSFTYGGKTQTFDISVKVKQEPKELILNLDNVENRFKQHETFNSDGLIVEVIDTWGVRTLLNTTAYTVTADTENPGKQYATVTYLNISKTYDIFVVPAKVESFNVDTSNVAGAPAFVYDEGETVDLSNLVVTLKKQLEDIRTLTADQYTLTVGGNPVTATTFAKAGTYKVTVTLKESNSFYKQFTITVRKVSGITLNTDNVKKSYKQYENIDFTNLTITANRTDGTSFPVAIDASTVSYSITNAATAGNGQTLTVTYTDPTYGDFTASYKIDVAAALVSTFTVDHSGVTKIFDLGSSIDVTSALVVKQKKELDPAGEVTLTAAGYTVTVNGAAITASTFNDVGAYTVRVASNYDSSKYQEFTVTVRAENGFTIDTTNVTKNFKKDVTFTYAGLVVTATYTNGDTRVLDVSEYQVTGGDTSSVGTKTVAVAYGTFTAKTYSIAVADNEYVFSVDTTTNSVQLIYEENETVDLSDIIVKVTKDSNPEQTLALETGYTITDYSDLGIGTHEITVTLVENSNIKSSFYVTIRKVSGITLNTDNVKKSYKQYENIDFTDLTITANRTDGTSFAVAIDASTVSYSIISAATAGNGQTLTVTYKDPTYGDFTASYKIDVAAALVSTFTVDHSGVTKIYDTGSAVDVTSALVVKQKKELDPAGEVTLTAAGYTVTVNGAAITASTFATAGTYTVRVASNYDSAKYQEFTVTVREVTGITLNTDDVTRSYTQCQTVDFSGLVITANRSDGTSFTVTDNFTISPDNANTAGNDQVVTVTYTDPIFGKFTATFTINVSAAAAESFSIDHTAASKSFEVGSVITFPSLVVKVKRENIADLVTLTANDYTVSYPTITKPGIYTVTITLKDDVSFFRTFNITVWELYGIYLDTTNVKTEYSLNEQLDLDGLVVVTERYYADSQMLSAADYSVDISDVVSSFPGTYTITVSYEGFSDEFDVVYLSNEDATAMTSFDAPSFVTKYQATSAINASSEGGFKQAITYRVGDDNDFIFKPIAKVIEGQSVRTVQNYEIEYKLFENSTEITGAALSAIVTYTPSTYSYDFTDAAIGHTYELRVSPKNTTKTFEPVCFTFQVVDGWNVYTAADLSMMANSNWTVQVNELGNTINEAEIWANYKAQHGVSNTSISGIILQTNLILTDADLPAEYFVTAAEDPTGVAVGHLKDWTYAYHHILADGENFCMYGNGFKIDIGYISTVYDDAGHVWGYGDDYSNCNIFKFEGNNPMDNKAGIGTNSVYVADLQISGNAMRTNDLQVLIPDLGGMIGLKFTNCNATLENTIITRSFIGIISDFNNKMTINKTKIYDSLQSAMFVWGGSVIHVNDSIMTRAGGPLIIMQHYDNDEAGYEERIPELYVDTDSLLQNYVNGQEAWFQNNGATSAAQAIVGLDTNLEKAATGYNAALSQYSLPNFTRKSILKAESQIKQGGNAEIYYLDFVNVMMSDGVNVGTAAGGAQGKTVVGTTVVSTTLEGERITNLRATLAYAIGAENAAQVVILENSNGQLMWTDGENLYVVTATNPAMTLQDFITAELTALQTSGGTDPIDTSFFTTGDYLTVHSGGMAVILKYN